MKLKLNKAKVNHLLGLLEINEREGSYYGNKEHYLKRHSELKAELKSLITSVSKSFYCACDDIEEKDSLCNIIQCDGCSDSDNFTGFYDDNKQPILVGDKLKSEWGYEVIVVKDGDDYRGELVCDDKHSCKNIPYALNKGKGYIKNKL